MNHVLMQKMLTTITQKKYDIPSPGTEILRVLFSAASSSTSERAWSLHKKYIKNVTHKKIPV
jgi:hypothetical protein